jgi:4-diphosphocytidyl-2-C-methyl-D-erythritol kinase
MSITTVKTRCPAKVNLTFQILGLLPDGYHEVKTLMQSVSLEDELTFRFADGDGKVSFTSVDSKFASSFPADESNLIVKAIRKFQQAVPESSSKNIEVEIVKRIPIGAGLAGGSSNAAAAIVAMNHQFEESLSFQNLIAIGASLGADVPFCLMGGTAVGTHKGDVLTSIRDTSKFHLLLVKPQELSISTPWAFKEFDKLVLETRGADSTIDDTTERCATIVNKGSANDIAPHLVNDLEHPVFHHYSELNHIREQVEKFGALRARLTGSGPTLYGLFNTRAQAEGAQKQLNEYQKIKQKNAQTDSQNSPAIYPLDSYVVETVQLGARVI